jgi:hypothetical protein
VTAAMTSPSARSTGARRARASRIEAP